MECFLCRLAPIFPETPACLCVSCRASVTQGVFLPWSVNGSLHLIHVPAYPDNPLGKETDGRPATAEEALCAAFPYEEIALEVLADYQTVYKIKEELLTLSLCPRGRAEDRARELIRIVRGHGVNLTLDRQLGRATIDYPKRLPYAILAEYVDLQTEVEDELTREEAGRIADRQERIRVLAARFGRTRAELETEYGDRGNLNQANMPTL